MNEEYEKRLVILEAQMALLISLSINGFAAIDKVPEMFEGNKTHEEITDELRKAMGVKP
jgi:hypothetical protein